MSPDGWAYLALAAAIGAGVCAGILGTGVRCWSTWRAATAGYPPRRAVSGGIEIQTPGRASDTVGHCLHCPWQVSDPSALAAHAALTEHVRAAHGGIP